MRTRGRQSAAELAVVDGGFAKRPEPPSDLTFRQTQIWHEIVSSEPAEFFNSGATRSLLAEYCIHREETEKITRVINRYTSASLTSYGEAQEYYSLLRMRDLETKLVVTLARQLRLTNQSRYEDRTAAREARKAAPGPKPWERDVEEA